MAQLAPAPAPAASTAIAVNASRQWVPVRSGARSIALDAGGDLYATDAEGNLWRLPHEAIDASRYATWSIQPGRFSRLIATLDGSLWALDGGKVLYRQTSAGWWRVAVGVLDVGASPDGAVTLLQEDGKLSMPGSPTPPPPLPPGDQAPVQLLVDPHGLTWLVYASGRVTRWNGEAWVPMAEPGLGLRRLAIGVDGSVFASTAAGGIVQRRPESGTWERYGFDTSRGRLVQALSAGTDGLLWAIDQTGEIAREVQPGSAAAPPERSPATFTRLLRWKEVGGASTGLALGSDGTAFSVSTDGVVWQWKGANRWAPLAGKFRAIAAGAKGQAWGLDLQGHVQALAQGRWTELPGSFKTLASDGINSVWAVAPDDVLYLWQAAARQWERVLQLSGVQSLAIGPGGVPWVLGAAGDVRYFSAGAWSEVPGIRASSIAIGPEGTVYAAALGDQSIFWLDKRERAWKPATGKAVAIAVGPGGAPWIVTPTRALWASEQFLAEEARATAAVAAAAAPPPPVLTITAGPLPALQTPLSFKTLATPGLIFQAIGIGGNGAVFALSGSGNLFCFSNQSQQFQLASASRASRIAVNAAGAPWLANTSGVISHFDKGAWQTVPEFIGKDVAVGPDGMVWAVDMQGESYKYNTASNRFERVAVLSSDAPVKARRIAGANAGVYWIATESNQLASCEKGACRTQLIGVQDVAVAPDNTVFALDLLGGVRRFNARTKAFEAQNGNGIDIAVGPQGLPWLVTRDGNISYAGLFNTSSRTTNTESCAAAFMAAPAPVEPPNAQLRVPNVAASVLPGGSVSLIASGTLNGRAIVPSDVTVTLRSSDQRLTLKDGALVVGAAAPAGAVLAAVFNACPAKVLGTCVSANAAITVASNTPVPPPAPPTATAPGAPSGVSAAAGDGQASVSFTAPASNGGSAITGYVVTSSPGNITAGGTASPIAVGGLTNGTAYTFTVRAVNAAGTGSASAASSPVTPTAQPLQPGVPGAPTAVSAAAGNGQASISFSAPASNGGSAITGYVVTSSPGNITASGINSPIVFGGLINGTPYTFTVRAVNAAGTGPASAPSGAVTPATVPGAPTNLAGTIDGSGNVTLNLTAPASNGGAAVSGYAVSSAPAGFGATSTGGATSIALNNYIAVSGQTCGSYNLSARAINSAGTGAASGTVRIGPPAAPTNVVAAAGAPQGFVSVSFTPPVDRGGMTITQYFVIGTPVVGPTLTASGASSPVLVDASQVQPGSVYTFTVTAVTGICDSPPSSPSNAYVIP